MRSREERGEEERGGEVRRREGRGEGRGREEERGERDSECVLGGSSRTQVSLPKYIKSTEDGYVCWHVSHV